MNQMTHTLLSKINLTNNMKLNFFQELVSTPQTLLG